ncbi:hypothetical protein [Legionella jordanis]|uniref:hypothetical protein n=1 Tax=Legionella jordanis TaxID=456 RepID=UPI000730730B|nr:hypothetical protein [Legionella jordanis]RMW99852.1 hypothetical protein EAW55_13645 [Legionella jordanis]
MRLSPIKNWVYANYGFHPHVYERGDSQRHVQHAHESLTDGYDDYFAAHADGDDDGCLAHADANFAVAAHY